MLKSLYQKFAGPKIDLQTNKKFIHHYFRDSKHQEEVNKCGYTIIRNCVSKEQVAFLEDAYQKLTKLPDYSIEDKFQNSGRFRSGEIRNFVMNSIETFSKDFLPSIYDVNVFDENTTGAFQIKPPSKVSELNPHQDAPVIDETADHGLFTWVPICDMTDKNGAVSVLPGSHLWNNPRRSLNVKWVFEKHIKTLWKYMEPVYIKKGDVICWDTSLFHASATNLSNETRVAITTTILPKNFKLVDYFKDGQTQKGHVEKYQVERSFWESGDIMKRPPCPPNQFLGLEEVAYDNISKSQLLNLIKDTQQYLNS